MSLTTSTVGYLNDSPASCTSNFQKSDIIIRFTQKGE